MKTPTTAWTALGVALVLALGTGCSSPGGNSGFLGGEPPKEGVTIEPPASLNTGEPSAEPSTHEPKIMRPSEEPEDIWDTSDDYVEDNGINLAAKEMIETSLTVDTTTDSGPTAGIERLDPPVQGYFSWEPEWTWGQLEGWDMMVREEAHTEMVAAYDSTDYAVKLEDTPTDAMRAVNVDLEVMTSSGDRYGAVNVIVFLSLKRKKDPVSQQYGPWTVNDAWESGR